MKARGDHSESSRSAALRVDGFSSGSIIEVRVDVGACREQDLGNADGIVRCLLPVTFNTVGADVMQQRGPMLTSRSHFDELRMLSQKRAEYGSVSANDRLHRQFKWQEVGAA